MHPYQVAPARSLGSSNATSPTSTDSPPVLTPATPSSVNKPLAPMPGSGNHPTISLNKTWVLPPKPKPGRKPALDTPPTKRKAQNREAQRAFRERRAAKVGELEDEMKKMEEEDVKEQDALRDRIKQLECNVENYGNMVEVWRHKFNDMQMACGRERLLREHTERELEDLRRDVRAGTDAVALPLRREKRDEDTSQQPNGDTNLNGTEEDRDIVEEMSMTCGKCSNDTRCQCIEEAFEMGTIADDASAQTFKRPHSPPSSLDNKRARQAPSVDEETEIDFTSQFSVRRPPTLTTTASTSSSIAATAPLDPCGFCSDGTPCICAEMAKDRSRQDTRLPPPLPPTLSSQNTNGLSLGLDPCINGPGTCAQCLSNSTSTLFCKSVAANRRSTTNEITNVKDEIPLTVPPSGPLLTCADAFTTLSRHPAFSSATNELDTWVPRLTAIPKYPSAPERTAFDIEAASVMSVLKFFDRRFGTEGENTTTDGTRETWTQTDKTDNDLSRREKSFIVYEPANPSSMNNRPGRPRIYEGEYPED